MSVAVRCSGRTRFQVTLTVTGRWAGLTSSLPTDTDTNRGPMPNSGWAREAMKAWAWRSCGHRPRMSSAKAILMNGLEPRRVDRGARVAYTPAPQYAPLRRSRWATRRGSCATTRAEPRRVSRTGPDNASPEGLDCRGRRGPRRHVVRGGRRSLHRDPGRDGPRGPETATGRPPRDGGSGEFRPGRHRPVGRRRPAAVHPLAGTGRAPR